MPNPSRRPVTHDLPNDPSHPATSTAPAGATPAAERARKPRRRRPGQPFYSVLDDREPWELQELAEPSLSQEIGTLRVRVAELLDEKEPDWKEALRMLEVLVRMVRIQQGMPAAETTGDDALLEFGRQVERLFGGEVNSG